MDIYGRTDMRPVAYQPNNSQPNRSITLLSIALAFAFMIGIAGIVLGIIALLKIPSYTIQVQNVALTPAQLATAVALANSGDFLSHVLTNQIEPAGVTVASQVTAVSFSSGTLCLFRLPWSKPFNKEPTLSFAAGDGSGWSNSIFFLPLSDTNVGSGDGIIVDQKTNFTLGVYAPSAGLEAGSGVGALPTLQLQFTGIM